MSGGYEKDIGVGWGKARIEHFLEIKGESKYKFSFELQ